MLPQLLLHKYSAVESSLAARSSMYTVVPDTTTQSHVSDDDDNTITVPRGLISRYVK